MTPSDADGRIQRPQHQDIAISRKESAVLTGVSNTKQIIAGVMAQISATNSARLLKIDM